MQSVYTVAWALFSIIGEIITTISNAMLLQLVQTSQCSRLTEGNTLDRRPPTLMQAEKLFTVHQRRQSCSVVAGGSCSSPLPLVFIVCPVLCCRGNVSLLCQVDLLRRYDFSFNDNHFNFESRKSSICFPFTDE